jgi:hypothetical protein
MSGSGRVTAPRRVRRILIASRCLHAYVPFFLLSFVSFGSVLTAGCVPTQQVTVPAQTNQLAPFPTFSAGQASLHLKAGMTEKEAIAAIGWRPDSAEASTCGGETGSPWQCRILVFGPFGTQLRVYLDYTNAEHPVVNSWHNFIY